MTPFPGMDSEELRRIMEQFQASPEDKKQAKALGLLGFGLSLAGARRGQELQGLGQAGLLGLGTYRNELKDLTQQRGQNLTQSIAAQDMLRRASWANGGTGPQPMQPIAPQMGGPGGDVASGPAPMPAPAAQTRPQGRFDPASEMRNMGMTDGQIAAVFSSKDPQAEFLKITTEYGKPILGQNKVPIVRGPDNTFKSVMPTGADANAASVEGAIMTAQEAAKAQFDTVPVPIGNGQTQMMTRADAVKYLQAQNPPAAPQMHGLNTQDTNRAMQDFTGAKPFERQDLGGPGVTPDPVAQHAALATVDTNQQRVRNTNAAQVQNSQTAYDDIFKQYRATREMAPHLANMAKLEQQGVFSGPAGAIGANAANWINSLLPDANVSGEKLSNTQTYQSEVGKMQQAIARSFPGSQSDAELRALTMSLPSLLQTPDGRAQIRDIMTRKVADAERQYEDASRYYKANGDLIGWKPPMFTPPSQSFGGSTSQSQVIRYDNKGRRIQ